MRWLTVIAMTLVIGVFSSQVHAELSSEIVEFGYYRPIGKLERERNYNTATGYVRTGTDVQLVEQTADIPMALGRLFGFKFRIRGFPRDEVAVNLDLAVTHPEIVRPNGTRVTGYRYPVTLDVNGGKIETQTGYQFDKEYEMVAGKWTFQYWRDDSLVLEQTFNVYDPTLLPAAENNTNNPTAESPSTPVSTPELVTPPPPMPVPAPVQAPPGPVLVNPK
ncbi:DUF3859 domain-containing protein [Kaarinaea lacus]